jgi:hypothetical protein
MELSRREIETLLECLAYSRQRVSEAQGTPYALRQEKLERLRDLQQKLQQAKDKLPD